MHSWADAWIAHIASICKYDMRLKKFIRKRMHCWLHYVKKFFLLLRLPLCPLASGLLLRTEQRLMSLKGCFNPFAAVRIWGRKKWSPMPMYPTQVSDSPWGCSFLFSCKKWSPRFCGLLWVNTYHVLYSVPSLSSMQVLFINFRIQLKRRIATPLRIIKWFFSIFIF